MLDYLLENRQAQAAATAAKSAKEGDLKQLLFTGQVSVVRAKVELITGYYYIKAFKEYLQRYKLLEEEQQQVCSIYNKGFSPYTY